MEIVTVVEKQHEVGFGLLTQDDGTDVLDVVVATTLAPLESVNVVSGLDVDAVNLVSRSIGLKLEALVLDHYVLVRIDELLGHLFRHVICRVDHAI